MKTLSKVFTCCILILSAFSLKAHDAETRILPFGLKYGMDTVNVNAIMDSLKTIHKVVDHEELGLLYIFKNGRRARILIAYDIDHGFSCIKLTTREINGDFKEARIKEIRKFLKEQEIIIDRKYLYPNKYGHFSTYQNDETNSVIDIYGGIDGDFISVEFHHASWNDYTSDHIPGRYLHDANKVSDSLSGGTIFYLIVIILICAFSLWAVISWYIKRKKGVPHEIETRALKLIPFIVGVFLVILLIAAIWDSLIISLIMILCFLAFGKEIFKI